MKLAFLLFTFSLSVKVFSQSVEKVINLPISHESNFTRHALLYTPDDYSSGSAKYPLIIFLHGPSEAGTDISLIYNNADAGGPAYFIEHGSWPSSFTNPNTGKAYKFIVVSPQSDNSWNSSGDETAYMVKYLVANYRVDANRIYITGLSAGGGSAIEYAAHLNENEDNLDSARTYEAAAIVTMSAATIDPLPSWANKIVANKIPAWGFGDPDNDIYGLNTRILINQMNNASAGSGIFTPDKYGHSGWGHFYTPDFKQTINGRSMNIYQWMLTNTRNPADTITDSPSAPPTVSAGKNKAVTLPASTATLSGHGQAAQGDTITYAWTNLSGPGDVVITAPTTPTTKIKGLAEGSYVFKLTVTQNDGQTASDTVSIAVNAAPSDTTKSAPPQSAPPPAFPDTTSIIPVAPTPPPPADTTTTLVPAIPPPASLDTTAQVPPAPASPDTTATPVTPPVTPPQVIPPAVTPPIPSPPPPIPPLANAGPNQFIFLPANSITLDAGTSTGTLSSYSWTELSGGAANILKPSAASTLVIGLSGGIHVFQLSVNGGASTSRVTVTVQVPVSFTPPGIGIGNATSSGSTGMIPPADSTTKAPEEEQITSNLLLHPNPASDNAFLEISNSLAGPMLVQIIDAAGVLRATYSFQKEMDHIKATLPVINLAHGLYFVHIRIGNWTRTEKLMKL